MPRSSRHNTRKKVLQFLETLKSDVQIRDVTNLSKEAESWNLNGASYSVMLRAMEIVKKDTPKGAYEWNPEFGDPDPELVETLINLTSEYQNA